jgi:methylmalonyl-CoA epimerase
MFARVDHIGVAVEDLDAAIALHEDAYGMAVAHREVIAEQGVEAVLLDVGENHVELLAPLGAETPVGKFLAKRGPGLHHVAYQVADIDATLATLKRSGMALIDEQPRVGIRGSRVAFLHPRATQGVLTEIVEPASGVGAH